MKQQTFSDIEYSNRRKKTKREEFLNKMIETIPWEQWVEEITPVYPKGKRGRPPISIETMLRMYLLEIWFNLSDAGVEEAIYDSYAMRTFMNIDFLKDQVPDATTLFHFRHLIEEKHISKKIINDIKKRLRDEGLQIHRGKITDAVLSTISDPDKPKEEKGKKKQHAQIQMSDIMNGDDIQ